MEAEEGFSGAAEDERGGVEGAAWPAGGKDAARSEEISSSWPAPVVLEETGISSLYANAAGASPTRWAAWPGTAWSRSNEEAKEDSGWGVAACIWDEKGSSDWEGDGPTRVASSLEGAESSGGAWTARTCVGGPGEGSCCIDASSSLLSPPAAKTDVLRWDSPTRRVGEG